MPWQVQKEGAFPAFPNQCPRYDVPKNRALELFLAKEKLIQTQIIHFRDSMTKKVDMLGQKTDELGKDVDRLARGVDAFSQATTDNLNAVGRCGNAIKKLGRLFDKLACLEAEMRQDKEELKQELYQEKIAKEQEDADILIALEAIHKKVDACLEDQRRSSEITSIFHGILATILELFEAIFGSCRGS